MVGMLEEMSKNKKSGSLTRGTKIITESNVTKDSILGEEGRKPHVDTKSIPANVRVDQGIRNTINALGVIGYGDSQKEVIQYLIDYFLSTLSEDELKKIDSLNEIYNQKDIQSFLKRKK